MTKISNPDWVLSIWTESLFKCTTLSNVSRILSNIRNLMEVCYDKDTLHELLLFAKQCHAIALDPLMEFSNE